MARAKAVRLELLSDWVGRPGAVRLEDVPLEAVVSLGEKEVATPDEDRLQLVVQPDLVPGHPCWPHLTAGVVVRVVVDDATDDWREWRVQGEGQRTDDGRLSLTATSPFWDLLDATIIAQLTADGGVAYEFDLYGLTPAAHAAVAVDALHAAGHDWATLGVVEPTQPVDVRYDYDGPGGAFKKVAAQCAPQAELQLRRLGNFAAPGGYALDILAQRGATAAPADLRFGKNIRAHALDRDRLPVVTRAIPRGGPVDGAGGSERTTMAGARWLVSALAGSGPYQLTLVDPLGGDGPVGFTGQLTGMGAHVRLPGGSLTPVTADDATTQQLTVASAAGVVAGSSYVTFTAGADGRELTYLDYPGAVPKVGVVPLDDVPGTDNLAANPTLRDWPGSPTAAPAGWQAVGGPAINRTTAAVYVRTGGVSARVQTTLDGHGLQTVPVSVTPTSHEPWGSGYVGLYVISGKVRVELVIYSSVTGETTIWPATGSASQATSSGVGVWLDLGASGAPLAELQATTVALRVVQHGAVHAEWYVDAGQITQTATQRPFAEGSARVRLWQAANEHLRLHATPAVRYEATLLDLARIAPEVYGDDCALVVGASARVTDERLALAATARMLEIERDRLEPANSRVVFSSRPEDFTGTLARLPRLARRAVGGSSAPAPAVPVLTARLDESKTTAEHVEVVLDITGAVGVPAYSIVAADGTTETDLGAEGATGHRYRLTRPAAAARAVFVATVGGVASNTVHVDVPPRQSAAVILVLEMESTSDSNCVVKATATDPLKGAAAPTITPSGIGSIGISLLSAATPDPYTRVGRWRVTRPGIGSGTGQFKATADLEGRDSDTKVVEIPPRESQALAIGMVAIPGTSGNPAKERYTIVALDPLGGSPQIVVESAMPVGAPTKVSGGSGSAVYDILKAAPAGVTREVAFLGVLPDRQEGRVSVKVSPQTRDTQGVTPIEEKSHPQPGRARLTITFHDPDNRVVGVRFRARSGEGTWPAWDASIGSPGPWVKDATYQEGQSAAIQYEVTGWNAARTAHEVLTSRIVEMGVPMLPERPTIDVEVNRTTGQTKITFGAGANTTSLGTGWSKADRPYDADLATNSLLPAWETVTRQEITVFGPVLAVGETLFVAARGYSSYYGQGTPSRRVDVSVVRWS